MHDLVPEVASGPSWLPIDAPGPVMPESRAKERDAAAPLCDYEGYDYRGEFWRQGRAYEDEVERVALRRLLRGRGGAVVDVGAGYGRLADEYAGFERVVLFDHARSLLLQAREAYGHDPRFRFALGTWDALPFASDAFTTVVHVRALHHANDVPALLAQLERVVRPDGHVVVEFPNKQNLKAIIRHAARRQAWSPYDRDPIEFAPLHYDYHPAWVDLHLRAAGFVPRRRLTVSHFRSNLLKRIVPHRTLVALDATAQLSGDFWQLSPSVFVDCSISRRTDGRTFAEATRTLPDALFACPTCHAPLAEVLDTATCIDAACGVAWVIEDGIYDFRSSLP